MYSSARVWTRPLIPTAVLVPGYKHKVESRFIDSPAVGDIFFLLLRPRPVGPSFFLFDFPVRSQTEELTNSLASSLQKRHANAHLLVLLPPAPFSFRDCNTTESAVQSTIIIKLALPGPVSTAWKKKTVKITEHRLTPRTSF